MRKGLALLLITCSFLLMSACSEVPAGNVGIKVYLLGGSKGVDHEVLGVGRYWIGMNEQLYIFPTFQQNYTWTKSAHEGKAVDESITFQTKEGMDVNLDVGISYHLNPDKIALIFQKYRKGIDEITEIYLRNSVRDAINEGGSILSVEDVYGSKKSELLAQAKKVLVGQLEPEGIVVDKLYLVGNMRLPDNVVHALNEKIEATQRAQQRQNEVEEAKAQANKEVAKAKGESDAMLMRAHAEAESNKLKQATLTEALIKYESVRKWDGALPTYMTGVVPFVNIK